MDQSTVRSVASRVSRRELGPDVQVRYRVAGGMPSQRLECEIVLDSENGARITRYDALVSEERERSEVPPDSIDVPELLTWVSAGLPSLRPTGERVVRPPDSLSGRLTIVVEDAEESFHVVPEPEKREPSTTLHPSMTKALDRLWDLAVAPSRRSEGDSGA